jgi:hypothetical protein
MKRKKWVSIGIGIVIVSLTIAVAAANSPAFSTPLYTVRMEQASSQMSFLPTEMNNFTYTTEKGYTVNYDILARCDYAGLSFGGFTCPETCPYTCEQTCPGICPHLTS